ncbi:MAG: hypothetical protein IKW46_06770 [Bacteroidaceae bacterium]|nr:hypothetical protein [Bacteroidaceae bacterium]
MKLRIITSFLLLVILGALLVRMYLPIWLWATLLAIFVVLFVIYLVATYEKEKASFDKRFADLEDLICKIYSELKSHSESNKNEISNLVVSGLDSVSKLADDGFAAQIQMTDSLLQSLDSRSSELKAGLESGMDSLISGQKAIAASLEKSDTVILGQIRTVSDEIKLSVVSGTEILKSECNTSSDNLIKLSKEHNDALQHSLEGISNNTVHICRSVDQKAAELLDKSDMIISFMSQSKELFSNISVELKGQLESNKNEISNLVASGLGSVSKLADDGFAAQIQMTDSLLQSLDSRSSELKAGLESGMDSLISGQKAIAASLEKSDTVILGQIRTVSDEIKLTQHSLEEISNQATYVCKTVEQKTAELVDKSDLMALDESISKMDGLRNESADKFSINVINAIEVLSGNIAESKELLQIVLRTISKGMKFPNVGVGGDEPILKQDVPTAEPSLKPNRMEEFFDAETGNIVSNHYKDGNLVKSVMKQKGCVVYEVEYEDDRIYKTRNYDTTGNVNIEQVFYENGQVHYRNEYTVEVTEFDINGKKK